MGGHGLQERSRQQGVAVNPEVSEYEGPIEVRIKGRRVSVPLGLARGVFVEEWRPIGR